MTMTVADTASADVCTQCPNLSLPAPRTRKNNALQTDSDQLQDALKNSYPLRAYLKANKYKIAFVTDEFEDWAWNDPYARCKAKNDQESIQKLTESFAKAASDRFLRDSKVLDALFHRPVARILLLHIGAFDAQMLPTILKMYKEKGVKFIPLSEAVKDPIYEEDLGLARGGGGDFEYNALKARGLTAVELGLGPGWEFPGKELERTCAN